MVSIGIIGIGNWGIRVLREYYRLLEEGLIDELYACDTRRSILDKLSQTYDNVKLERDYRNLEVDGVHIAVPNELHYTVASYFLNREINVLVEKPMTKNYREAVELVKIAEDRGVILKVGHIFRFNNGVRELYKLVNEGQLGEIYNISFQWKARQVPFPKEQDIIFDLMPHPLDIMLNLLNEKMPRYLFGSGKSFVRKSEGKEEWATATLEYEDGKTVIIETSWIYPSGKTRRVEVNGSNGHAILDALNQSLVIYTGEKEFVEIPVEKNNTIRDEIIDFVQSIKKRANFYNSGEIGANVVRLLELIRTSIDTHLVKVLDDLSIEVEGDFSRITEKTSRRKIIDCLVGKGTKIYDFVDLYKCIIGKNCKIDSYVYIEENVKIGNNCKIRAHTFIPQGVKIGNNVFIGPGVRFTNDKYPKVKGEWKLLETIVEDNVSIGAGAIILPGLRIGKGALIGAGAVVTRDIPPNAVVIGNPSRVLKYRENT